MRNTFFIFLATFCVVLISCNDEEAAGPGISDTFIKLFGSVNSETANDMVEELDGGLVILSTTQIEESVGFSQKIKIIRTDNQGNTIWESSYPESDFVDTNISYIGSSIMSTDNGYIIIGDRINSNNKTSLLILELDKSGTEIKNETFTLGYPTDTTSIHGVNLVMNSVGEFKALGLIDTTAQNIWVGTYNNNFDLDLACTFRYSAAAQNTRLLKFAGIEGNDDIILGLGLRINQENGRLVRVPSCQGIEISGPLIANQTAGIGYSTNQICDATSGYGFVGTTTTSGNSNIFLARVNDFGVLSDDEIIVYTDNLLGTNNTQEQGQALTRTADGGFLLGGTSLNIADGENDIILIKTDFQGNVQWTQPQYYGDQNADEVVVLKQASSGGYLVLGNTEFGGISALILIKTDKTGSVN